MAFIAGIVLIGVFALTDCNNSENETTYTVTFNSNGGTAVAPVTVSSGEKIASPSPPVKAGNTFGGWFKEAALSNAWNFSSDTVTSDITLYAKWSASTLYTVTFNSNSGTGNAPAAITQASEGASILIPGAGSVTRSGYVFGGWNTNTGGTGVNYPTGTHYTPVANITLYAKWNAETAGTLYTVTFDKNGGTGTAPAAIKQASAGASITIPGSGGLTKSGYTFGGWNTEAAGTGMNYSSGVSYTPTSDITLYAKWTSETTLCECTVTWHYIGEDCCEGENCACTGIEKCNDADHLYGENCDDPNCTAETYFGTLPISGGIKIYKSGDVTDEQAVVTTIKIIDGYDAVGPTDKGILEEGDLIDSIIIIPGNSYTWSNSTKILGLGVDRPDYTGRFGLVVRGTLPERTAFIILPAKEFLAKARVSVTFLIPSTL